MKMTSKRRRLILLAGLVLLLLPAALLPPWFGARRIDRRLSPLDAAPPYRFPQNFLFGTATAAQQIEHAQDTDWTAFERAAAAAGRAGSRGPGQAEPGHIRAFTRYPEEVRRRKTNHDEVFGQDLAMAASMGHNAYRFSISWARLFPRADMTAPDPAGLAYYRALLAAMKRHNLQPFATLFHFDTPAWLWQGPAAPQADRRGFERPDALAHFERYVKAVAEHLGGEISLYCTLNEPMVYVYNGFLEGIFPPHERRGDPARVAPLVAQLLRAHAIAYRLLKEDARRRGKEIQVGYTQHTRAFQPYRDWAPLDRVTAAMVAQAFMWDLPDAVQRGALHVTGTSYKEEIPGLRGAQDYVGINYYGRFYIKSDLLHPTRFAVLPHDPARPDEPRNDLGWAIYPRGFGEVLREAAARYRLPLYVLENGTADGKDDDQARQEFLVQHLRELWIAMRGGVDVRGYFHWSLIDNFEWAEGFEARFGLVKVDYLDGYRRTPRPSAALYGEIIREGITEATARRYGAGPMR